MPINENGQGQSANTPIKQDAFRYFMAVHAGIVKRAQKWGDRYYYIDTNAGTGKNTDRSDGSVLIACEQVKRQDLQLQGYAIDIRADALDRLQTHLAPIANIDLIHGDNAVVLRPLLLPYQKWLFGLVYCDPNGVDDLPLDALIHFFHPTIDSTQRIDVLLHFSATALKRCQGAGLQKYTLQAIKERINKQHWYIREPVGRDQWTFLFGTNYDKWPPLNLRVGQVPLTGFLSLGMFKWESTKGQESLDKLLHTNAERQKKRPQLRFPIEPIVSTLPIHNSARSAPSLWPEPTGNVK